MQAWIATSVVVLLATACLYADENASIQPGALVFQTGFDTQAEREAWPKADFATWVTGYQGSTSLCITAAPGEADRGHLIKVPLDLAPYRGCRLLFERMVKGDRVDKPPKPYLGVKFMLHYMSRTEGPLFRNEQNVHGTFDWRKSWFTVRIAPDAVGGEIALGLQASSGTAYFDDINITVMRKPVTRPAPPLNLSPPFRGHDLPRLRGVMSPNTFRDEDLRVLGTEWKANVIRWQLTRNWGKSGTERDLAEYEHWLEGKLAELDRVLEACHRYGIKVVVDMHSPPGGRYANMDLAIFHEAKYQDYFVALWEKIARRYQGNPAIWGYDLINEPVQFRPPPPGVADYLGAQVRTAEAIRKIDPEVPIFIAAGQGDSPGGYRELEPVAVSNVIYQVHMYVPHPFTHQGVRGEWKPVTYPGEIGGKMWDKAQLRKVLEPVREFQLAYNIHIYVGEFSAIRWAPGAARYLGDCIDLFEEYGWDWTYHAYREWDGWSVEHGSDPKEHQPTATPTDRKELLLKWFGKNVPAGNARKASSQERR